jgi:acyl-ACP thioesterase
VRFDALARFLQDAAIEDVQETGWGMPEHLWFLRRIRIDVLEPFLDDRELELVTWSSATAAIAAGRRWSLRGDRGGRAEVDSVWIHLDPAQRPARIEGFDIYGESTGGRRASTKLELPDPPPDASREPWPLRATDIDLHGHVNNAVYWQAVEQLLTAGGVDPRRPLVAELDYREPIDLDDRVELVAAAEGSGLLVGFRTAAGISALARLATR